jgi:predicted nucleic acid-binding protein
LILDTNALSAFIDGDEAVGAILREQSRVALPVIVLGEFRYGIAQSKHRVQYEKWLAVHLAHFEVLPVTERSAVAYAALRSGLKRGGHPIPANDAWIAALAIQHKRPILSRDRRFELVEGVALVTW